jgi:transposase
MAKFAHLLHPSYFINTTISTFPGIIFDINKQKSLFIFSTVTITFFLRRNGLLRTGKDFYENRQGHGRKRKLQPIVKFKSRYNNFKKTTNHKIARAVVNFALSVKAGVIVLENLSGIHDRTDDLFLKNWPYYQLQRNFHLPAFWVRWKILLCCDFND